MDTEYFSSIVKEVQVFGETRSHFNSHQYLFQVSTYSRCGHGARSD